MHASTLPFLTLALAAVCATARPLLQERNPQGTTDYPGVVPEATSLIASLFGDGKDALISAIYGDTSASSALAAATSAAAAGNQGAAESYLSEATAAVASQYSQATDAAVDQYTSFTSAYDANNGGYSAPTPTTVYSMTGSWTGTISSVATTSTSTPRSSGINGNANASATDSMVGAGQRSGVPAISALAGLAAVALFSLL